MGGLVGRYLLFIYLLHFNFLNRAIIYLFILSDLTNQIYHLMVNKKNHNQVEHVQRAPSKSSLSWE
jgi:hypothetical protein